MLLIAFLGYKDLIVTPMALLLVSLFIFYFKKFVPQKELKPLFLRALFAKIFSAIILGLVYQFYYGGGDTSSYFMDGGVIYESFFDSKLVWLKLVFGPMVKSSDTFIYTNKIYHYGDSQSYFVVRTTGLLNMFTFNTYSSTAILFAVFSFNGIWHMFLVFRDLYPKLEVKLGYACFFLPSLCFWGSGILKDSLLVGGIGWAFYGFYNLFFVRKRIFKSVLLLLMASLILFNVKPFVLVALFPPLLIWYIFIKIRTVKSNFGRTIYGPIIFGILFVLGFTFLSYFSKNTMFDITKAEEVTQNIKVTKDYLLNVAKMQNGSAYDIGDMDGSILNALSLAPSAIWVTFFRPYLWESRNVNMLLAALESSYFLFFTLYAVFKVGLGRALKIIWKDAFLLFCFTYSMFYGFIVGLSSANFGTLVRYKIPILPFYLCGIIIVYSQRKIKKKKYMI
jgi:hypothetical protein